MRATPLLNLKKTGARWNFDYFTPETAYAGIKTKEDLLHELEFHANPHIKMHTPDSPKARRFHVEIQRPALRWFCKKFGVNIPSWLVGNAHYDELPPEQSVELFGEGPLKVREYEEWPTEPHAPESPMGAQ